MGQQPLVAGPQLGVVTAVSLDFRLGGIGALRQCNQHAEALGRIHMAGCVMQGGGVNFHQGACRCAESLDLCGVQLAIGDVVHLGQQQDEILGAQVELTVAVVFQAVQFGVVAVAPAQLDRHAAKQMLGNFHHCGQLLQNRLLGHIVGSFRQRGGCQRLQDLCLGSFQTGYYTAIRLEFGIIYRIDLHCNASISAYSGFRAGYSLCHSS